MQACVLRVEMASQRESRAAGGPAHGSIESSGSTLAIALKRAVEQLATERIGTNWVEGEEIAILVRVVRDRR